jgi:hypothetical protein
METIKQKLNKVWLGTKGMKEIWKYIENFYGYYEVSNRGRIRSVDRYVDHRFGYSQLRKGKMKKITLDKDGYGLLHLYKNNKNHTRKAHRLVLQAFVPNPENKPQVNHINGNKLDNRVENLEWCTDKENKIHAFATGLRNHNSIKKKVLMSSKDNEPLLIFDSITEASRETGINLGNICSCCKGKIYKTVGGYKWSYYKGESK